MPAERTDEEIARDALIEVPDYWSINAQGFVHIVERACKEARAQGVVGGMEKAAKWHNEQARGCKAIAETTRREWCGPNVSKEDRRANYADAREHDILAGIHERNATALRSLAAERRGKE